MEACLFSRCGKPISLGKKTMLPCKYFFLVNVNERFVRIFLVSEFYYCLICSVGDWIDSRLPWEPMALGLEPIQFQRWKLLSMEKWVDGIKKLISSGLGLSQRTNSLYVVNHYSNIYWKICSQLMFDNISNKIIFSREYLQTIKRKKKLIMPI